MAHSTYEQRNAIAATVCGILAGLEQHPDLPIEHREAVVTEAISRARTWYTLLEAERTTA